MLKKILILGLMSVVLLFIVSCDKDEQVKEVTKREVNSIKETDFDKRVISANDKLPESRPLNIAVGSMITPKAGFAFYRKLIDYIGERLNRKVTFIDRENYAEINRLVESGHIDVAFVCGKPYVDGHDEFGMELLAAPQAYGETVYYSYIIVPHDSPVKSFEGLRGTSFAFTDPMSNSGMLVPTYMLAMIGETPNSFFQDHIYTYAHDKSITAVAQGIVDGAAVDSLIWEYINRTKPEVTSRTRIIEKSPPYGIPPVVVNPGIDPVLKEKIKGILLNMHNDAAGIEILKGMMIDRFIEIDDSAYDSIREMKSWVAGKKQNFKKRSD